MYFNLEKVLNKKIDINPKQIVSRAITPFTTEMNKEMKLVDRVCNDKEVPKFFVVSIITTNPNISFSIRFDTLELAEQFLKQFKEDL